MWFKILFASSSHHSLVCCLLDSFLICAVLAFSRRYIRLHPTAGCRDSATLLAGDRALQAITGWGGATPGAFFTPNPLLILLSPSLLSMSVRISGLSQPRRSVPFRGCLSEPAGGLHGGTILHLCSSPARLLTGLPGGRKPSSCHDLRPAPCGARFSSGGSARSARLGRRTRARAPAPRLSARRAGDGWDPSYAPPPPPVSDGVTAPTRW